MKDPDREAQDTLPMAVEAQVGASYELAEWSTKDRAARSPEWKRLLYRALRPAIALEGRRHLSREVKHRWGVTWAFCRRGLPLEERRELGLRGTLVHDATLLVQGTGSGWDVVSWAEFRPRKIIAVDAWAFEPSWTQIAKHCHDKLRVPVEFREAPLQDCSFMPDGSVDLCVSDAVLEHVQDLPAMLSETKRILSPQGHVYAAFGPLWFAPGGDHFSVRGGLANVYAHLDRSPAAYRSFFAAHKLPVEDFQSGGRYVELDLFSKLTVDEYLRDFRAAGFRVDELIAEVCPLALGFERRFPERVRALLSSYNGRITRDDLRTKGVVVRLSRS